MTEADARKFFCPTRQAHYAPPGGDCRNLAQNQEFSKFGTKGCGENSAIRCTFESKQVPKLNSLPFESPPNWPRRRPVASLPTVSRGLCAAMGIAASVAPASAVALAAKTASGPGPRRQHPQAAADSESCTTGPRRRQQAGAGRPTTPRVTTSPAGCHADAGRTHAAPVVHSARRAHERAAQDTHHVVHHQKKKHPATTPAKTPSRQPLRLPSRALRRRLPRTSPSGPSQASHHGDNTEPPCICRPRPYRARRRKRLYASLRTAAGTALPDRLSNAQAKSRVGPGASRGGACRSAVCGER